LAFHAAAFGGGFFVVLTRRQGCQRIGQGVFFLFLGHPSPRSQSL
jgi:hypothetical protein